MLCFSTLHEFTLINHTKLVPGWELIQVNFGPIQEIGPKVGSGHSLEGGRFFARLWCYDHVKHCQHMQTLKH